MPVATPIDATSQQLADVRYNADGLVPAIVQDEASGAVLMMGWMNADSLAETLATGRTVFWSRSRQERWRKGDTSGDRQWVRAAYYDCDGDTLLFVVEQEGAGACHTGDRSCFYRPFGTPADRRRPMSPPSRDDFASLARQYTVVPVWRELLADLTTPVAAFARLAGDDPADRAFLLESVEHAERWGRWSFVGRRPSATLIARDGAHLRWRATCPAAFRSTAGSWRPSKLSCRSTARP